MVPVVLLLAVATLSQAPAPPEREEIIAGLKELEQILGFPQSRNFLKHSESVTAYYRCYFTGKLDLPESYDELDVRQTKEAGCSIDPREHDLFFYPIEAVANGNTPVTSSLAGASTERLLMVVPHEDFHEHREGRRLPATVTEAAATLAGFITAATFARDRFGEDSPQHRNLARDAELFLEKARIVNCYHEELSRLYAAARSGRVSKPEALRLKEQLFARLRRECNAISPDPVSFNKCPGALNNAGLAFDHTYTRYYPSAYQLYTSLGRDAKATIQALRQEIQEGTLERRFRNR